MKHLSATQLNLLARCGEAYRRRYIEGEVIPPRLAMAKGRAYHAGVEMNMRQKARTGVDLPPDEIVDRAVAQLEQEIDDGVELDATERSIGKPKVVSKAVADTVEFAKAHAQMQAPEYMPLSADSVEKRIELPTGDRHIVGVVDLIDSTGTVIDFKSTGRAMSADTVANSVQLGIYAAWQTATTGIEVVPVRLDVLVAGSKGVRRQVLKSQRNLHDLVALNNRVESALGLIRAGVFLPASPDSWQCSPRWCGFWDTCPYISQRLRNEISE